jgi:hypothetical protein
MIVEDIRQLLPLYALGALDADEATVVERAIASDPALAAELEALREVANVIVMPVAPPAHVKSRLLASVGGGKFEKFSTRMASLFDVSVERAREILALVERPASWELPMPGIGLVHFDGGPACATADCGFVRLDPGATFPPHVHRGEETSLVIAGQLRDGDRILSPGDELVASPGAQMIERAHGPEHVVMCVGDEPCIYVARAFDGIEIGGVRAK